MNQELLEEAIDTWEPPGSELIRIIDTADETVERITKLNGLYYLHRYFTLENRIAVSLDLNGVTADRVIQELAERL